MYNIKNKEAIIIKEINNRFCFYNKYIAFEVNIDFTIF